MNLLLPYNSILIYGVGLMGASLALSIRNRYPNVRLTGLVRSEKSKKTCLDLSLLDDVFLESEFLEAGKWDDYDLIVFGTPVHLIKKQIENIPKTCKATITDMGSTKKTIVDSVENYYNFKKHNYISSHPMCGSENAGPENAIENLYQDKLCLITSLPNSNTKLIEHLQDFWKSVGMLTHNIDPDDHDFVLAYLSHSPHILSSIMVEWANNAVGTENSKSPMPIMGGGFRDMARIAGSNPEMWQAILSENQAHILRSLIDFQSHLNKVIDLVGKGSPGEWKEFFSNAAVHKNKLYERKSN